MTSIPSLETNSVTTFGSQRKSSIVAIQRKIAESFPLVMFVVLTLKTLEEILPFNKLNEAYTQGDWLKDLPNKYCQLFYYAGVILAM